MKIQVKLSKPAEPIAVPYPEDYQGSKTGMSDDLEFYLSTNPSYVTLGELELANQYVKTLPYAQSVFRTGCVMGILPAIEGFVSEAELDIYEQQNGFESTKAAPNGGKRGLAERKILLTERVILS